MNHLIPLLNVIISPLIFFFNYLITLGPGMMERRKWCDIMWKTIFTYFHVPIPFLWFLLITKYINELTRLMDSGKDSACQCRRCRFDPWVEKISWRRKWHDNLFQYSCLETSMDRGTWRATVHGITDTTEWLGTQVNGSQDLYLNVENCLITDRLVRMCVCVCVCEYINVYLCLLT